jgi:hypothetical protein
VASAALSEPSRLGVGGPAGRDGPSCGACTVRPDDAARGKQNFVIIWHNFSLPLTIGLQISSPASKFLSVIVDFGSSTLPITTI